MISRSMLKVLIKHINIWVEVSLSVFFMRKEEKEKLQHVILYYFITLIARTGKLKFHHSYWNPILIQNSALKVWGKKEPNQKNNKKQTKPNTKESKQKTTKTTEKNPYALLFYKLSYENSWKYSCISNENL